MSTDLDRRVAETAQVWISLTGLECFTGMRRHELVEALGTPEGHRMFRRRHADAIWQVAINVEVYDLSRWAA